MSRCCFCGTPRRAGTARGACAGDLTGRVSCGGRLSNLELWEEQVKYFEKDYTCVSYDRRGSGQSLGPAPGAGHSCEQQAADAAAVAVAAGISTAYTVAHAGGCPIACALARESPALVW